MCRYQADDNFAIIAPTSIMGLWNRITGNAFGIAIWITSVFLVVGGVVIMNIMLASVTERTREIGLRKSLGARKRHIILQFMVESSVLAAMGGLVGVTAAVAIGQLVRVATPIPISTPIFAIADSAGSFHGGRACFSAFIRRCAPQGSIRSKRCARRTRTISMQSDFRENLQLALDTVRAHKLRSFLAILGVMIGVALIILVVGLVQGFRQTIQDEIVSEGIDTAFVSRFDQGPQNGRHPKEEKLRKPLTLEDAMAIRQLSPAIKEIAVSAFQWQLAHTARYQGNIIEGTDFRGTFPAYLTVYSNATMKAGRFFTEAENEHRDNVVVIGENVAKAFFPSIDDALGKEILVDGSTYTVVGVFEKPPNGFGTNDEDRRTVIPYYTFMKLYPGSYEIGYRFLAYPGKLDAAVDQVREVLRRRRDVPYDKPDNFSIQTQVEVVQQFNDIIGGVVLAVVVLSSIGLLIGGMGVMNIMLVSVTERTREIGVRKAIGARSKDITWQFLFEAMTLTGTGGIIGILVGSGIVLLIPVVSSLKAIVPAVGHHHRLQRFRRHRPDLRSLARHESGTPQSGGSSPLRIIQIFATVFAGSTRLGRGCADPVAELHSDPSRRECPPGLSNRLLQDPHPAVLGSMWEIVRISSNILPSCHSAS